MEFIVFLLLMIFVFVNGNKKKNKNAPAKPAQKPPVEKQAEALLQQFRQNGRLREAKTILDEAAADPEALLAERRARLAARRARKSAPAPAPAPAMGSSAEDGEGCLGGSMPHDHHEGEGRAEHARHVAAMARREEEESLTVLAARELDQRKLTRLRQAVVMAEVLGKPKALRRGSRG